MTDFSLGTIAPLVCNHQIAYAADQGHRHLPCWGGSMRRVNAIVAAACLLLATSPAQSQPDPLRIFNGLWTWIDSPGLRVIFNQESAGQREASLPFGHATISRSDGRDDSNFKVSGHAL